MKIKKYIEKRKIFIIYILLILLIRLFLSTSVRIWAFSDNQYDDGMMLRNAANLIAGKWLGAFDQYTLAKGITFPLYLAFIHKFGIPFIFGNVLLCFGASLTFIMVLKKIIPNKNALAIIYTILMFNPIASDTWSFQRAYRDSIYSYLVVILFSLIIAIYLNRDVSIPKLFLYCTVSGFFLSAVWLAREDSPWVMPFVVVAIIITAFSIFFNKQSKHRIKRLMVLTTIPIFLILSILTVSAINYSYYGIFATNEYTGGYLPDLFKALTTIKPDSWSAEVPISKSTREKAYEVSPTFAKLKPILENHTFLTTASGNASCSMLVWAVVDSVEWYGLKDGRSSQQFYKQSAKEINDAIANGKLKTRGGYLSVFESPWDNRYIKPLIKSLSETLRMTIHMSQYENVPLSSNNINSFGTNTQVRELEYLTNNLAYYTGEEIPKRQTKLDIINKISKIYYTINPFFFVVGILSYLYITLRFISNFRKKNYYFMDEFIILSGIFLSYILRVILISYTDVCSIFMKYPMYLAPSYWLVLMFTFTSIFVAIRDILKRYNSKQIEIKKLSNIT